MYVGIEIEMFIKCFFTFNGIDFNSWHYNFLMQAVI